MFFYFHFSFLLLLGCCTYHFSHFFSSLISMRFFIIYIVYIFWNTCICLFSFLVLLGCYADTFPLVFILQPTTKQADGVLYNNFYCIYFCICVFLFMFILVFVFVLVFVLAWVCCGHISISLHIASDHRTSRSCVPE